uniref:Uncharacterized protein n=1 Tax=Anguilla anguilla TaxID=7936 RepID=A0A0E9PWV5_ANGAN
MSLHRCSYLHAVNSGILELHFLNKCKNNNCAFADLQHSHYKINIKPVCPSYQ